MDKLSKENQKLISDVSRLQGLSTFGGALKQLEAKLLEMESKLKQANEWISVEDRLPENDDEVLVCIGDDVSTLQYNPWGGECPNSWFDWNEIPNWGSERVEILGVTHWKPLPKPPTGE